jgi:hypothetical protein
MDEEGKVRRNLVVFSAALLAVAWFELPVQLIASKALSVEGFSSARAWAAAGVVLGYLVLRYHFSPEALKLSQQVDAHLDREHWARVHPFVLREVEGAYRSGGANDTVGRELQVFTSQVKTKLSQASAPAEQFDSLPVNVTMERGQSIWVGSAGLNVGNGTAHYNVRYEVPRTVRRKIRIVGFFKSWVYSDTGINLVFPYVIAVPAAAVIAWKLVAALLP